MHRMCDGSASEAKMRPWNKSNLGAGCHRRPDEVDKNFTILCLAISDSCALYFSDCGCQLNVFFCHFVFYVAVGGTILQIPICRLHVSNHQHFVGGSWVNAPTGYDGCEKKGGNKMLKLELVKFLVDGCRPVIPALNSRQEHVHLPRRHHLQELQSGHKDIIVKKEKHLPPALIRLNVNSGGEIEKMSAPGSRRLDRIPSAIESKYQGDD